MMPDSGDQQVKLAINASSASSASASFLAVLNGQKSAIEGVASSFGKANQASALLLNSITALTQGFTALNTVLSSTVGLLGQYYSKASGAANVLTQSTNSQTQATVQATQNIIKETAAIQANIAVKKEVSTTSQESISKERPTILERKEEVEQQVLAHLTRLQALEEEERVKISQLRGATGFTRKEIDDSLLSLQRQDKVRLVASSMNTGLTEKEQEDAIHLGEGRDIQYAELSSSQREIQAQALPQPSQIPLTKAEKLQEGANLSRQYIAVLNQQRTAEQELAAASNILAQSEAAQNAVVKELIKNRALPQNVDPEKLAFGRTQGLYGGTLQGNKLSATAEAEALAQKQITGGKPSENMRDALNKGLLLYGQYDSAIIKAANDQVKLTAATAATVNQAQQLANASGGSKGPPVIPVAGAAGAGDDEEKARIRYEESNAQLRIQGLIEEKYREQVANEIELAERAAQAKIAAAQKAAQAQIEAVQKAEAAATKANEKAILEKEKQDRLERALYSQQRQAIQDKINQEVQLFAQTQKVKDADFAINSLRLQFPAPSNATFSQLQKYENELTKIHEYIVSGKLTLGGLNEIKGSVQTGKALPNLGPGQLETQSALQKLGTVFDEVGIKGTKSADAISRTWERLKFIFAVQIIHQTISRLIQALKQGIEEAAQFEIKIAEIRTLSQEGNLSFGEWAKGVRQLSDEFGKPIDDVAKGVYQSLSGQLVQGAESIEHTRQALELARVTVSSTAEAVTALDSVLNSFGLDASQTERVAGTLFKTVQTGRVTLSELAPTLGKVGSVAHLLGLSVEEVTAGIDVLSKKGVSASEAANILGAVLSKLLRPTEEMKRIFDQVGVSSGQAFIQLEGGLGGALQKMAQIVGTDTEKFGELGSQIRAVKGFVSLATDGAKDYNTELAKFATSSESYAKAQKEFQNLPGQKLQEQLTQIKNFFTVTLGTELLDKIIKITDKFGGLATVLKYTATIVGTSIALWGTWRLAILATQGVTTAAAAAQGLFAAATEGAALDMGAATVAAYGLKGAMTSLLAGSGIGLIALAVGAIATNFLEATDAFTNSTETAVERVKHAKEELEAGNQTETTYDNVQRQAFEGAIRSKYKTLSDFNADRVLQNNLALEKIEEQEKSSKDRLKIDFEDYVNREKQGLSDIQAKVSDAKKSQAESEKYLSSIRDKNAAGQFQRELKFDSDPVSKQKLINDRIRQLTDEADALGRKGDRDSIESARQKYDEIEKLTEDAFSNEVEGSKKTAEETLKNAIKTKEGFTILPSGQVLRPGEQINVVADLRKEHQAINDIIAKRTALEEKNIEIQKKAFAQAKEEELQAKLHILEIETAVKALLDFDVTDKTGKLKAAFVGATPEETKKKIDEGYAHARLSAGKFLKEDELNRIEQAGNIADRRQQLEQQADALIRKQQLEQNEGKIGAAREAETSKRADTVAERNKADQEATKNLSELQKTLEDFENFGTGKKEPGFFTKAGADPGVLIEYADAQNKFNEQLKITHDIAEKIKIRPTGEKDLNDIKELTEATNDFIIKLNALGAAADKLELGGEVNIVKPEVGLKPETTAKQTAEQGLEQAQSAIDAIKKSLSLGTLIPKPEDTYYQFSKGITDTEIKVKALGATAKNAGTEMKDAFSGTKTDIDALNKSLDDISKKLESFKNSPIDKTNPTVQPASFNPQALSASQLGRTLPQQKAESYTTIGNMVFNIEQGVSPDVTVNKIVTILKREIRRGNFDNSEAV